VQLETFTGLKPFVSDPHYHERRRASLDALDCSSIDEPMLALVKRFAKVPYCFTLQSCYGHFLFGDQKDPKSTMRLPVSGARTCVDYRVAYLALCIQNTAPGRTLFQELRALASIDPEYVQFGCAGWFWRGQVNSYVLQVEPERHKTKDQAFIPHEEALYVQEIRDQIFSELHRVVRRRAGQAALR
jgi:hypothetical protein